MVDLSIRPLNFTHTDQSQNVEQTSLEEDILMKLEIGTVPDGGDKLSYRIKIYSYSKLVDYLRKSL